MQARGGVRELTLVDEETGLRPAGGDLVQYAVEGEVARAHVAECKLEHVRGRGQRAGSHDLERTEIVERELLARDDDRPVAIAERGAVRQQHVPVGDGGIGARRERSHLQPALERPFVERLDIGRDRLQLQAARVHLPSGERPDHERVVWIGAVSNADRHRGHVTLVVWRGRRSPSRSRTT